MSEDGKTDDVWGQFDFYCAENYVDKEIRKALKLIVGKKMAALTKEVKHWRDAATQDRKEFRRIICDKDAEIKGLKGDLMKAIQELKKGGKS